MGEGARRSEDERMQRVLVEMWVPPGAQHGQSTGAPDRNRGPIRRPGSGDPMLPEYRVLPERPRPPLSPQTVSLLEDVADMLREWATPLLADAFERRVRQLRQAGAAAWRSRRRRRLEDAEQRGAADPAPGSAIAEAPAAAADMTADEAAQRLDAAVALQMMSEVLAAMSDELIRQVAAARISDPLDRERLAELTRAQIAERVQREIENDPAAMVDILRLALGRDRPAVADGAGSDAPESGQSTAE